jgi:hypothetical protein
MTCLMNRPRRRPPQHASRALLIGLLLSASQLCAEEAGPTPIPVKDLSDHIRAELKAPTAGKRIDMRYQRNSDLPPKIVGGNARPVHELVVRPADTDSMAARIGELSRSVLQKPALLEAVKKPERVEFLGGRVLQGEKDDRGVESPLPLLRLKYFSHEIRRVVMVDVTPEGEIKETRIRDAGYQAPLTRNEVQRAEKIARAATKAPKDLARYPIARALLVPPAEDGARVAYVMFRNEKSRVWRYEALVDLSRDEVRQLNRIR